MTLGERIKYLRKKRHMTLEDVGKTINVERATVSRYESGTITNIPSDKIELMARAFSVSPAYLMGWEDEDEVDQKAIEEERVLEAYWNADPVYREVAMDILVQHPAKKANEAMSAG